MHRLRHAMSSTKSIGIGEIAIVVNVMKPFVVFCDGCEVARSTRMGIYRWIPHCCICDEVKTMAWRGVRRE